MIRCEWGRQTASNLLLRDLNVQFRTYKNVDHEMDTSEVLCALMFNNKALSVCTARNFHHPHVNVNLT